MSLHESLALFHLRLSRLVGINVTSCHVRTDHITGAHSFYYVTHRDYRYSTRLSGLGGCLYQQPVISLRFRTGDVLYVFTENGHILWDMWLQVKSDRKADVIGIVKFLPPETPYPSSLSKNGPYDFSLSRRFYLANDQVLMISLTRSLFEMDAVIYTKFEKLEVNIRGPENDWVPNLTVPFQSGFVKLNSTLFKRSVLLRFHFKGEVSLDIRANGLQILSSYHKVNESITEISPGLFNCSQHYAAFRHHLGCNLRQECLGGEDETEACPYTNHRCPHHSLYVQGKCILLREAPRMVNYLEARQLCQSQGGDLATLKTPQEMALVRHLWDKGISSPPWHIGLKTEPFNSNTMYRMILFWVDGAPDFFSSRQGSEDSDVIDSAIMMKPPNYDQDYCAHLFPHLPVRMLFTDCQERVGSSVLCEQRLPRDNNSTAHRTQVSLPVVPRNSSLSRPNSTAVYTDCDAGRFFTHQFLTCDPKAGCRVREYPLYCPHKGLDQNSRKTAAPRQLPVAMFQCYKTTETVHYTLVCDHRRHCSDGSEEANCQYQQSGSGSTFWCFSGHGIVEEKMCDKQEDCVDGSDEYMCGFTWPDDIHRRFSLPPPALINLFGRDNFGMEPMPHAEVTCPGTHFPCPGKHLYCLPVYLRCNRVKDCLGGEDEVSCDDVTCPGYYRCRSSSVCLHVDHVCDGWPQCPERDDELLCDVTCPSACHCQGLAFVCHQPFPVSRYPNLRYLDATGSGMAPADASDNFYLVFLSLTACGVNIWPKLSLLNLQTLDLRDNSLTTFHLQVLHSLPKLRKLLLSKNPLVSLVNAFENRRHKCLEHFSLDHTFISVLNISSLTFLSEIRNLNLSYSSLTQFNADGQRLVALTALSEFDVRGCNIEQFPRNLFQGLRELRLVYAQNYKFCCRAALPHGFNHDSCFSEQDEISSCEDLLGSNIYQVFLWIIAITSLVGNAASLTFKYFYKHFGAESTYGIFVLSLSLSDILMSSYSIIIGCANEVYRGQYLWHENAWRTSLGCGLAGFVCLLCYEVSALMVCLITVDRFVVLRFPFSTVRFTGRSAVAASVLIWTSGLVLAAVPMLPALSHWRFYSQTGLCVPLPVTRQVFPGKSYAFGILVVFNFVLFLVITAGQLFIYWAIQSNVIPATESRPAVRNATFTQRLIAVAVSVVLCWVPVGVLALAASAGVPVPGEVSVAVAVLVLPLTSALNPFLYTYSTLVEKRRRHQEVKLFKELRFETN